MDVVKTLEAVRRRLLALEVLPARSWLLFYDAELSGEYIGLRSASPRPPLWSEPVEQAPMRPERPAEAHASRQRKPTAPAPEGGLDSPNFMIDPLG